MNKILLHQQSTAKTGPRLLNCTLCHDWSMGNGASMIRVNSNCRTYSTLYIQYDKIHYSDFWMGGYLRSGYHILRGKFLLVFTSGDETCSSMVIQVHQDIGDTGYIQIQVTQYTYIITRRNTE